MKKQSLLIIILISITIGCYSQPGGRAGRPMINRSSPEVLDDKSVIFRFFAPEAEDVKLSAEFLQEPLSMIRDTTGLWTIKTDPVKPDIYPYFFLVDGIQVQDPGNVLYFSNERFKRSLVDIPGETPLVHSLKDVPHGSVTYCDYYSDIFKGYRPLVIYTPPEYDKNSEKKYPVFYLISGTTDTEETYFKVGRTNLILDNHLAEGKVEPMIVVMPYGNPSVPGATTTNPPAPGDQINEDPIENDLINNIIPYVESNYRTLNDNDNRAIGGFSRGGGQTLRIGFKHPELFSWICSYSSFLGKEDFEKNFRNVYEDPERTNEQMKLLWISVGNEDFLYEQTVEFMDLLKEKNIDFESMVTSGGHTWMNMKQFMDKSSQLLFK